MKPGQLELYRHAGQAKAADQRVSLSWFARMREEVDKAPDRQPQTHKARVSFFNPGVAHPK